MDQAKSNHEAVVQKVSDIDNDPALSQLVAAHPEIAKSVLLQTAALHAGDEESVKLWEDFLPKCRADIQKIYGRLDIEFDVEYGESFYHEMLPAVVQKT